MTDLDLLESGLDELARMVKSCRKASLYYQNQHRYAREKYGFPAIKLFRSRKVRKRKDARRRGGS